MGHVIEEPPARHVQIRVKLTRQIPDAFAQIGTRLVERDAEERDAPAIRMQQLHQQADGGGFAGAVRA